MYLFDLFRIQYFPDPDRHILDTVAFFRFSRLSMSDDIQQKDIILPSEIFHLPRKHIVIDKRRMQKQDPLPLFAAAYIIYDR